MAATVPANPLFPALMPAIDFQGADAGVVWNDFSPRVGFTYDLTGDGRNVVSSSYAVYYGQMAPGSCRASSPPPARCSSATPGPTRTATASSSPPRSTPPCRS